MKRITTKDFRLYNQKTSRLSRKGVKLKNIPVCHDLDVFSFTIHKDTYELIKKSGVDKALYVCSVDEDDSIKLLVDYENLIIYCKLNNQDYYDAIWLWKLFIKFTDLWAV